jgi:hypothetical protein
VGWGYNHHPNHPISGWFSMEEMFDKMVLEYSMMIKVEIFCKCTQTSSSNIGVGSEISIERKYT